MTEIQESYSIGDFIEYKNYRYNGSSGRSNVTYHYGCIISKSCNKGYFDIIKQFGGQVWLGIEPICKITEEKFLKKFSIYDEYIYNLLNRKLPEKIGKIIKKMVDEKMGKVQKKVFNYAINNYFNNPDISIESWYIEWYIYYVLRNHEPDRIKNTLEYCYGATDLIKKFMKENTKFMIDMQFLSQRGDNYMIYLIESEFLEFKYSLGLIKEVDFCSKIFKCRIKKLEYKLKLKVPLLDKIVRLEFIGKGDKKFYKEMSSKDLLDTQFIFFKNKNFKGLEKSSCNKKIFVDLKNSIFKIDYKLSNQKKNNKYKYVKEYQKVTNINTKKSITIDNNNEQSRIIFNDEQNLLLEIFNFSFGLTTVKSINLYCPEHGNLLGNFQMVYDELDLDFDIYNINVQSTELL
jgi:hypothetical protein